MPPLLPLPALPEESATTEAGGKIPVRLASSASDRPDGGGCLLFLQPQLAAREAKGAAGQRDGAGGDQDHLRPARAHRGDIGGDTGQPALPRGGAALIHDEGRADLHHDAAGGAKIGGGGCGRLHGGRN